MQRSSHNELVKTPGKYRELWHVQAQYYAEPDGPAAVGEEGGPMAPTLSL